MAGMRVLVRVLLLHCLAAVGAPRAVSPGQRESILGLACGGELEAALGRLRALGRGGGGDAGMLHARSALELLLRANASQAVAFHKAGKARDGKLIPPLAQLYLDHKPCVGLADLFYYAAVSIKQLVDADLSVPAQLQGHETLITLLSDSGLARAAELHLMAALSLRPGDPSLLLHALLMTPAVFESGAHLAETRALLQARLQHVGAALEPGSLPSLDEFSLPPSFYLVYQGFDDRAYLEALHAAYARAYPALDDSAQYIFSPPPAAAAAATDTDTDTAATSAPAQPQGQGQGQAIRVGFVSSHLRRHSVCKLFCGVIRHLNDASHLQGADRFEIYVFSTAPASKEDGHTAALRAGCGAVTSIGPGGVTAASEAGDRAGAGAGGTFPLVEFVRLEKSVLSNRHVVRSRSIDVLVYLDIGMDPANLLWAAARLAPVQAVAWGHPSTTGLPHVDYFISSELFHAQHSPLPAPSPPQPPRPLDGTQGQGQGQGPRQAFNPASSEMYSEQLVLFSSLGMFFERPLLSLEGRALDPAAAGGLAALVERPASLYESLRRTHLGNRELAALLALKIDSLKQTSSSSTSSAKPKQFILCPQQLPKFHPNFDYVIASVLRRVPGAVLVVLDPAGKYHWRRTLEQRWLSTSADAPADAGADAGTDAAPPGAWTERVLWLGRLDPQEYLAVLALGDVMVDPYPFGGGVTTLEALAVCTPVLSLPAHQTVPQLTAGMLAALLGVGGAGAEADAEATLDSLIAHSEEGLVDKIEAVLAPGGADGAGAGAGSGAGSGAGGGRALRAALCAHPGRLFAQGAAPAEWARLLRRVAIPHSSSSNRNNNNNNSSSYF
jgi:glycosyltransferase involved in cell wall biosynthesis